MVLSELSLLVMSNSLFFIPTNIAKEYQYYYLSHRSHLGSFFFFTHPLNTLKESLHGLVNRIVGSTPE